MMDFRDFHRLDRASADSAAAAQRLADAQRQRLAGKSPDNIARLGLDAILTGLDDATVGLRMMNTERSLTAAQYCDQVAGYLTMIIGDALMEVP